jgi:hypothetical protein
MKKFSLLLAAVLLTSCSHPIEIVGVGDVFSDHGRVCTYEDYLGAQDRCTRNYVIGDYQETYLADPDHPGWYFEHWENYCTDDTLGECAFDISGNAVQQAWGQTVPPLVAVFIERNGSAVPASKIITVDGRQWIRPRLFNGVKWSDIAALCPAGVCSGVLMGFDLGGWNWASVDDVNALFNHYIGSDQLGPGPDNFAQPGIGWQAPFWDNDWGQSSFLVIDLDEPPTLDNLYRILEGYTRDCLPVTEGTGESVQMGTVRVVDDYDGNGTAYGMYSTNVVYSFDACADAMFNGVGAWFYLELP